MPIVEIKGVGKAEFPYDMDIADIRAFLRNKYYQDEAQGISRALDPAPQTAAPYEPTLAERAGSSIGEKLKSTGLVSDTYGAQRIGRNVSALAELLPVVGDATAGDEFGRALQMGNYGEAALHGVGTIPVIGDMAIFAGALAKNADLGALKKAQKLELQGSNRDEIWKETGWFNDKGDWKFEISDALDFDTGKGADINPSSFKMIKEYGGTTKENFMGHPELYEAYPNLKDRPVRSIEGRGGNYRYSTDTTNIGESLLSPSSASELDDVQSVGLHEIQHAIQNREGFASGGNPEMFSQTSQYRKMAHKEIDRMLDDNPKLARAYRDFKHKEDSLNAKYGSDADNWPSSVADDYYSDADKVMSIDGGERVLSLSDNIYNPPMSEVEKMPNPIEQYERLAGEAEARLVQKRMNMTPDERKARAPWLDLDVPEDELIYRKGK